MKWRIRKLYVPRYDRNLYIPEYKGIFFWKSFKCEDYHNTIHNTHNMGDKYELVHSNFDLFIGFKKLEEDFIIEERSLVDVLNEIYAWGKDTEDRLDYHSL